MKDWRKLNFTVPLVETAFTVGQEDFLVRGTAINATITRNGVKYTVGELSSATESLIGKPILKDHDNSVDSIVGKVVNARVDSDRVLFEGNIMDEDVRIKIEQGLIGAVSVGATVKDIEEVSINEDTGEPAHVVAKGIEFLELSLVAVPGDPNAGITQALAESFDIKNKTEEFKMTDKEKVIKEEVESEEKPSEEESKGETPSEESSEDESTESKGETKTEDEEGQTVKIDASEISEAMKTFTETIKNLSEKVDKLEEKKEAKTVEVKEKKDSTKGKVAQVTERKVEESDPLDGYTIEKGDISGYSLSKKGGLM